MKSGAKIVVDRSREVAAAIEKLASQRVMVGYPASSSKRKGKMTNAALGYIHDNGAPEAGIPARPHMIPGVKRVESHLAKRFEMVGKAAFKGESAKIDVGLTQAGMIAQNSIKAVMALGVPPPLAPATLAARKRRGRTGEVPLIDTGQLRNSVSFVIRKAKK